MATTTAGNGKTVTGYPPPQNEAAAGYPAGAAAHPFAVPPPSSYYSFHQEPAPASYYPPPPPPPRTSFLCRLLTGVAIGFAVFGSISLIIWLALKPRFPAFRVDSATVTSLGATGTELNATWDITFVVRNPNRKLSLSYESIDAKVWYGLDGLASTRLPPLFQGTLSESRVRVQFSVVNEYVDRSVTRGIAAERARGSVNFGVTVLAWVRFKSGILGWRDHHLRVVCDPVSIAFPPNNNGTGTGTGTLMGPSRWCAV